MRYQGLFLGGDDGNRTHDLLLAKQMLYQLSYVPVKGVSRQRDHDTISVTRAVSHSEIASDPP